MKLWHRKDGDYWDMQEDQCYPGTKVFVHQKGHYFSITLVNTSEEVLVPEVELSREAKRAHSGYRWRTITSAKRNARLIRYDRDWLQTAGIEFNETITDMENRSYAGHKIWEACHDLTN